MSNQPQTMNPDQMIEYRSLANLDLYDSQDCDSLATQAATGRQLRIVSLPDGASAVSDPKQLLSDLMASNARSDAGANARAVEVCLCEDDYSGWIVLNDLTQLEPAPSLYQPVCLTQAEIEARLPAAIAFAQAAMQVPNYYLWGGTVGPNYDCSGLMQAAFQSAGIWLPRDSYQQADFLEPIAIADLQPGDLIFFAKVDRVTHVALYLGNEQYIHSSGKDMGRNGIGIDRLSPQGDAVSQAFYRQFKSAGRAIASYQPKRWHGSTGG